MKGSKKHATSGLGSLDAGDEDGGQLVGLGQEVFEAMGGHEYQG